LPALLVLWLVAQAPASAQELASVREYTGKVTSLSFSPDGKRLVSVGPTDGKAKVLVWDMATRKVANRLDLDDRRQVLFAGDNDVLAVAGNWAIGKYPGHPATLVDPSGKLLYSFPEQTRALGGLYAVGGNTLLIGYYNTSPIGPDEKHSGTGIEAYDLTTRKRTYRRVFEAGVIKATAVARDGKHVALAFYNPGLLAGLSDDNPECAAVVFDLTAGRKPVSVFTGHKEYVGSVAFAPDGKSVATAGREWSSVTFRDEHPKGSIRVWDAATGKERFRIDFAYDVSDHAPVIFSPDGKLLATSWCEHGVHAHAADDWRGRPEQIGVLKLFDAATGKELADLRGTSTLAGKRLTNWVNNPVEANGRSHPAAALAFSSDGKVLVSGHSDGTIKFWDVTKALERPPAK
jgi:WD40 repeat protein